MVEVLWDCQHHLDFCGGEMQGVFYSAQVNGGLTKAMALATTTSA